MKIRREQKMRAENETKQIKKKGKKENREVL
jgi:hypothetical protein